MTFDIKKYCYANYPLEESGNKFEYEYEGLNLFYVISGQAVIESQDENIELATGQILCALKPCKIALDKKSRMYCINLTGEIIKDYIKDEKESFFFSSIFVQLVPSLMQQLIENYNNISESFISSTAFNIISILSTSENRRIVTHPIINDAIRLIHENYHYTFGVDELARNLNISKSHLVREFYKHTGTTPGKYLTNVRIDAVKVLLEQTAHPLNVIATKTGFSGDNYLCKAFKKVTGETPIAYKNRIISSQYLPNQLTFNVQD